MAWAGSLAAHVGIVAMAPEAPEARTLAPRDPGPVWTAIEWSTVPDLDPEAEPVEPPGSEATPPPARPRFAAARRPARDPRADAALATQGATSAATTDRTETETPGAEARDVDAPSGSRAATLDLSPRATAALALGDADRSAAGDTPGRAGDTRGHTVDTQALDRSLRAMANARPHVSRRPPPELEPQPDGSLRFQGHVFEATIRPDGTVAFVDAPPIQGNGAGLTFDITDRIERAVGNDPYAYERRWFLESTQELRDDLASRHRDHAARRGLVLVWRQAEAIWTSDRPAAARRRALFDLWDACDEDQHVVREAILDFIRAALPEDSAEAYTPAELRAYAARRASRAPFTPY